MINLRQDPFESLPAPSSDSINTGSRGFVNGFFAREFWRFVLVQQ